MAIVKEAVFLVAIKKQTNKQTKQINKQKPKNQSTTLKYDKTPDLQGPRMYRKGGTGKSRAPKIPGPVLLPVPLRLSLRHERHQLLSSGSFNARNLTFMIKSAFKTLLHEVLRLGPL